MSDAAKIDEMQKAIMRLPTPPAAMGDGPDERVGYLLDLVKRLGEALRWALQEVEDSTEIDEDYTMPLHECEYTTDPEKGKCAFHEGYSEARALLLEIKE